MDSYAVDNPKIKPGSPPEPLTRYMQASYFLLRDANWWPDFPQSAQQIAALYQQHQGREVDSVVALDSRAVAAIFEALGPLDLPAYNEQLTAQNFEERLRYYYLPPGTEKNDNWWLKRKQFIGVVLNGLLSHLNEATLQDYVKLANQLSKAMSEKHLQVYFNQPDLEAELTRRGLDGTLTVANNDYLMVVDTNVGFNKVSPKLEQNISYSVVGSGGNVFASLTLTYTNRAGVREGTQAGKCVKVVKYDSNYEAMMNGCYWDYVRVYVPDGSVLQQATGFTGDNYPTTNRESGHTVFASQLIVPPGEALTVTFDYLLPSSFSNLADYRLVVQKQAGATPASLAIQLHWLGLSRNWITELNSDLHFDLKHPSS
jgi:hypothetical protein